MNTFILDFENYNLSEDEILSITEANTHLLQKPLINNLSS